MIKGRKICVITGTRAEYGLLYWTMKAIEENPCCELNVIITGMHLSPEFGLTGELLEKDSFKVDAKVECLVSSDTEVGITKSIGLGIIGFADAFERLKPDIILLLGDRFEIFAAATAAMIAKIPIAHCHGGEATEGVVDEPIRHSITKMSHLHFTSTEEYRKRVIQLGEHPDNVWNVGALGIENINKLQLLSRHEFESSIDFNLGEINFLVTFHPVTLDDNSAEYQFVELLKALDQINNAHIIFTLPNADTNGRIIIELIKEYTSKNNKKAKYFTSLGQLRYLSAIQYIDCVVGNSSSGLIEIPSFNTPTVNIGDRQRGRAFGETVINCEPNAQSILSALKKSLSEEFKNLIKNSRNPYGSGNSSEKIIEILSTHSLDNLLKKRFYNL